MSGHAAAHPFPQLTWCLRCLICILQRFDFIYHFPEDAKDRLHVWLSCLSCPAPQLPQSLTGLYFCVLGAVYLLCPLNPRMLAFILFTHQYYIPTKALSVAFKSLCRVVLKCTSYCEGSSLGNSRAPDSHYPA